MSAWLETHKGILVAALLVFVLAGSAVWWERRPVEQPLLISSSPARTVESERNIVVDVDGAVVRPGLYTLAQGARVADAIDAAGGATDDADLSRLNRAVKLKDEQQVRVPRLLKTPTGALPQAPAQGEDDRLVDINSASLAQLEALPGIGTVTAGRILEHRQRNGPFARVDQLKETKLVTGATFEKVKDLITAR